MPTLPERTFLPHPSFSRSVSRPSDALRKLVLGAMSLEGSGVRQQAPEVAQEPPKIAADLGEEYGVERFLEGLKAAPLFTR